MSGKETYGHGEEQGSRETRRVGGVRRPERIEHPRRPARIRGTTPMKKPRVLRQEESVEEQAREEALPVVRESAEKPIEMQIGLPVAPIEAPQSNEAAEEEPTERVEPKRATRGLPIWLLALSVMGLSLAVAVGVMIAVLRTPAPVPSQGSESENEEHPAEEQKVIYIREYDQASGLLTVPELYAACADSVVSILTRGEAGSGIGSGFILTEDGYIGTANHVIEGMETLAVVLADGRQYAATPVAGNERTDLAVLKIEAKGLPTVRFASSDRLLVGERVVTIGTPASLDYAGSVSTGEISYLYRTVKIRNDGIPEKKMTLIQTTAPVNPGHSGCPLFDEYGHVVGIVTMKLGSDYTGIGFAIPSEGGRQILEAMIRGESLSDTLLGAVSQLPPRLGITGEAATVNGLQGIRILSCKEGTDASSVLKVGDLLLNVNGVGIASQSDLLRAIGDKDPGDVVRVTVLRGIQSLTFDLILGK